MPFDSPASREARERIAAYQLLALRACDEIDLAYEERFSPWSGRSQHSEEPGFTADQLVALEFGRSTKTFRAAVALATDGYGQQAAMLNRSLFEGMAVAHWIHQDPAAANDRFVRARRFERHLTAEVVRKVDWAEDVDEDELEEAALEGEELKRSIKDFGRYGHFLWTGHEKLRDLVRDIEGQWEEGEGGRKLLWDFLEVAHRDNNKLLHSTVVGLADAFGGHEPGGGRIWVGPSTKAVERALFGAHWIYAQTFTLVADRFELADRDELTVMLRRHDYAFVDLTADDMESVTRNDPCPCQSGSKYKACHLDQVEAISRLPD